MDERALGLAAIAYAELRKLPLEERDGVTDEEIDARINEIDTKLWGNEEEEEEAVEDLEKRNSMVASLRIVINREEEKGQDGGVEDCGDERISVTQNPDWWPGSPRDVGTVSPTLYGGEPPFVPASPSYSTGCNYMGYSPSSLPPIYLGSPKKGGESPFDPTSPSYGSGDDYP